MQLVNFFFSFINLMHSSTDSSQLVSSLVVGYSLREGIQILLFYIQLPVLVGNTSTISGNMVVVAKPPNSHDSLS
jgi:hypothetical protein